MKVEMPMESWAALDRAAVREMQTLAMARQAIALAANPGLAAAQAKAAADALAANGDALPVKKPGRAGARSTKGK